VEPLTVVLTLRDRVSYTARWMEYANYIAFPFQVIVADGSSDGSAEELLSKHDRFPDVHYTYVRYPYDETYTHYYSKLVDVLDRVRTPFVTLADNDDFFIVECMLECVRFLQQHPDYLACGGLGGTLWLSPSSFALKQAPLYAKEVTWKCTNGLPSIEEPTARERLQPRHLGGSDICYYDVKRTDELRKQFRIVRDLNLHDLFLVEWLVFFLTCVAGKTKRLPRLYLARQQDSPGGSGATHTQQFGDWLGRMLVDSWSEDFGKFASCISAAIADTDGISEADARAHVIRLYRMGIAPSLLSNLLDEPNIGTLAPAVFAIVRRIVRMPETSRLRRLARRVYRNINAICVETDMAQIFRTRVPGANNDIKAVLTFLSQPPPQY
jgi:glycosyltransferase domain-containing protein